VVSIKRDRQAEIPQVFLKHGASIRHIKIESFLLTFVIVLVSHVTYYANTSCMYYAMY